jgi:hypothetical protein
MKPVIIKSIIFLTGLAILFSLKSIYLLHNDKYKDYVRAKAIYKAIEKSKRKKSGVKALIIGDSVGFQLFNSAGYNDSIYSLTTNQAISLTGQYILLTNFLSVNHDLKNVVMIYTPFAFKRDLNQQYTFQYFLKPFYRDEYKRFFSVAVENQVKQIPFYQLCQFAPVLTSDWSPDYDGADFSKQTNFISELSNEYLSKIVALCHEHGVKLVILPTPTRISKEAEVKMYETTVNFPEYNFRDYFSRVTFIPDSLFLDDVHLKDPGKFLSEYLKVINDL